MLSLSAPAAALANESTYISSVARAKCLWHFGRRRSLCTSNGAGSGGVQDLRARAREADFDRPRGMPRPCRLFRGDRLGCQSRLLVQPTCHVPRASAPRTLRHCMGHRARDVDQHLSAGVSGIAYKLEACCARSTRARYRCGRLICQVRAVTAPCRCAVEIFV